MCMYIYIYIQCHSVTQNVVSGYFRFCQTCHFPFIDHFLSVSLSCLCQCFFSVSITSLPFSPCPIVSLPFPTIPLPFFTVPTSFLYRFRFRFFSISITMSFPCPVPKRHEQQMITAFFVALNIYIYIYVSLFPPNCHFGRMHFQNCD